MNIILAFATYFIGWGLGVYLDRVKKIKIPPIYWTIGTLSGMGFMYFLARELMLK